MTTEPTKRVVFDCPPANIDEIVAYLRAHHGVTNQAEAMRRLVDGELGRIREEQAAVRQSQRARIKRRIKA